MTSRPNQVRIIAGQWRGRKLSFPNASDLRPTPDRIRETLFNWLMPLLPGACCLDLFAGSGALGFEAASRGAGRVVMVECRSDVVALLRLNRELLSADAVEIRHQEARDFISDRSERFDLVFLDPPFQDPELLAESIQGLTESGSLNVDARIYVEMPVGLPELSLPKSWLTERQKRAGQVAYSLYRFQPA